MFIDDVVDGERSIEYLDDEITRIEKGIRVHVDKNPGMKNDLELMRSTDSG
ncbi:hypothetical protein FACS1894187_14280 [Synergistales bacterium]|nr:hypothetical protein FACS1894187_14280 [Synergistales bacterium]